MSLLDQLPHVGINAGIRPLWLALAEYDAHTEKLAAYPDEWDARYKISDRLFKSLSPADQDAHQKEFRRMSSVRLKAAL